MITIKFYLKDPNSDKETSIFLRACYSGHKVKYYISERIDPRYWDNSKQKARSAKIFKQSIEFNSRLEDIKNRIYDLYRRYQNDNKYPPSPDVFKELLNKEFRKSIDNPKDFVSYFEEIILKLEKGIRVHPKTGKQLANATVKTYKTTLSHIKQFEQKNKRNIHFEDINLEFYSDFTEYLITILKLANNSVGKDIKVIKTIMAEGYEYGLHANISFKSKRFLKIREEAENVYLSDLEIDELYALNLSFDSRLESVRDLFIIGCYTGLRFSDYTNIHPDNIKDNILEIKPKKTSEIIAIPLHERVKYILDKYNGFLPKPLSNQKTNECLKEIGKLIPSFKKQVQLSITKGGMLVTRNLELWQAISTHTARRSFATNLYLQGFPSISIMKITGHKTETSFMKYIKVSQRENAISLSNHWKRNDLKTTNVIQYGA